MFDEIDNKRHKLYDYKAKTTDKINTKITLLNYLRIVEPAILQKRLVLLKY